MSIWTPSQTRFLLVVLYSWSSREGCVESLPTAGADPHIRDGCGNTVPRYLADCSNINSDGLTESGLYSGLNIELRHDDRRSSAPRELLYMFLKRGVDVRARNNERLTAVRILLDTGRTWLEKTRMVLRQSVA